jgi:hypothetical protein
LQGDILPALYIVNEADYKEKTHNQWIADQCNSDQLLKICHPALWYCAKRIDEKTIADEGDKHK